MGAWVDREVSVTGVEDLTLPPEPATVGHARRAVRKALNGAADPDLVDAAELVVSELVTNAVVHAATEVHLHITAEDDAIRVEVEDGSTHLPVRRTWAQTAGTGRGLLIVEQNVDRWSAARTARGKVVWFEIGHLPSTHPLSSVAVTSAAAVLESPAGQHVGEMQVTLLDMPLLMHWAWQEHATTLLREFLLFSLEDDPRALDDHAAASDALSILREQVPTPQLPSEAGALMASSVEPTVTADKVVLQVPAASLRHFETLDMLLERAVGTAESGRLLGPPTQPEIAEMRRWLCGEVAAQTAGSYPTAWQAHTDVRVQLDPEAPQASAARDLAASDEPIIATNEASLIVAVTRPAVEFLGYDDESDLLGRRILVVVPMRFHQAHIAGTTLHVTNGRDALLRMWIDVPVVRADGSEVVVGLHVEPYRIEDGHSLFVARMRLPEESPPA